MEENWALARKKDFLRRRAVMIQAIRRFFIRHDYLEVETPCLIPAPAPEAHIDAVRCGGGFLHTSPELSMKRLLAAGYPRIFQICKCFRGQERGALHLPEFTMLEWYHTGLGYRELMEECEELLSYVFRELGCSPAFSCQGRQIAVAAPWERITVAEAFSRHAPLSVPEALEKDCFDQMMADYIEPNLGGAQPTFICDYPLHPGSLAKAKKDAPALTERFELYMGGWELANGFTELTDAEEQRRRFKDAERVRLEMGKPAYPPAERFLAALAAMPEASGIALGLDRLAMIINDRATIDDVVAFVPEDL